MAGIFRGQSSAIARSLALLTGLLFAAFANSGVRAQLHEQPALVVEPGMHTARIWSLAMDAAGRIGATGSEDKTVRVWSLTDGKLLQTIRMPAGPGGIGKIFAVSVSPDGAVIAAGGWTSRSGDEAVYLFEAVAGKMVARIKGLPANTTALAFSPDGRHLVAGLTSGGLRVFDRDGSWSEVFRDTDYGGRIYGLAFAADGRLATTSYDGNVRLYDRDFKLVVPPTKTPGGHRLYRIAFSPDGGTLVVGDGDAPEVYLLDGHSLAQLPRPNVDGLEIPSGILPAVAWSSDGKTLYAAGTVRVGRDRVVVSWGDAGRGERHTLPVALNTIQELSALPDGRLLVAAQDPFLGLLEPDGRPRWTHHSPQADFRVSNLAVSADGTIVDFGFEAGGKSPLRFDLHTLKLVPGPPADHKTAPAKQTGLAVKDCFNSYSPTLDGNPIKLKQYEMSRSLAIHPDERRFVLGTDWNLYAIDARGKQLWTRTVPDAVWAVNQR